MKVLNWNNKQLFDHLVNFGVQEGRQFSISFDSNYYRSVNSDLAAARLDRTQLLEHFAKYGLKEGRKSSESFDVKYYLDRNSDLKALGLSYQQAEQHFEIYGFKEGRQGAEVTITTDPGNTFDAAFNLGFLNGSRSISQSVNGNDPDDFYRFTVAGNTKVELSINILTSSSSVGLNVHLDRNGNGRQDSGELVETDSYISSTQSLNLPLAAGTYVVRISGSNARYTLGLSATSNEFTTSIDPGNTLNAALDLGTLSDSRKSTGYKSFVGVGDLNDYYRFSLDRNRDVNIKIDDLIETAWVDVILDKNGNGIFDFGENFERQMGWAFSNSSPDLSFNMIDLQAGAYFVRVFASQPYDNTYYSLNLLAS